MKTKCKCYEASNVLFWQTYPPTHVRFCPIFGNLPTYPKIGRHMWTAPYEKVDWFVIKSLNSKDVPSKMIMDLYTLIAPCSGKWQARWDLWLQTSYEILKFLFHHAKLKSCLLWFFWKFGLHNPLQPLLSHLASNFLWYKQTIHPNTLKKRISSKEDKNVQF